MHLTILALGSRGDVLPYAALGGGLRQAGHQVRFITFESYANLASEREMDFHPIPGDAQSLVAQAGANMLGLIRSFSSLAESYVRCLSADHLGETDLLINQLPAGLLGYDLAEKYRLPMVLASVIPLARTDQFPLMGFPPIPLPGYNRWTYRLGEQMAWQMFRRVVNRWRVHSLGLDPLPLAGYASRLDQRGTHILNGFSRHVVERPKDWGAHIHTTGYWFPHEAAWQPPADLQAFLQAGAAPVFFGFGSMPVKDPQRTVNLILKSLELTGQRGILHAGWGGLGAAQLPAHVYPIEYAPYGWLFPRMKMSFHHGGSGTTGFGLLAGVPSCVIPFVFDQFYWGRRIAALGAGPAPIPFKKLTPEKLAAAIQQALSEASMQRAAAELGRKIQAENGISSAVETIERIAAVHHR